MLRSSDIANLLSPESLLLFWRYNWSTSRMISLSIHTNRKEPMQRLPVDGTNH